MKECSIFSKYCIVLLLHLRYCRQNAEGNHSPGPKHHEDQDHRSTREKILRMDRWFHPGFIVHLPTDVDFQAGIRRIWTIHRTQEVLLSLLSVLLRVSALCSWSVAIRWLVIPIVARLPPGGRSSGYKLCWFGCWPKETSEKRDCHRSLLLISLLLKYFCSLYFFYSSTSSGD